MASRWLQLQAAQHFAWQTNANARQERQPEEDEREDEKIKCMIEDVESAINEYNSEFKKSLNEVKPESSPSGASSKNETSSPPPLDLSSTLEFSVENLFSRSQKDSFPSNSDHLSMLLKDNPFLFRPSEELVSPTSTASLPSPRPPNWPIPIIPSAPSTIPPPPLSLMPKSLLLGRGPFNNELKQRLVDNFPHLIRTLDKQSVPRMNFNHLDPRFIASRIPGFPHPLGGQFQVPTSIPNSMVESLSKTDVQHLASTNRSLNDPILPLPKILPMSVSSRSSSTSTPSSIDTSKTSGVPQDVFRCIWCQEQYHSLASLTEHLKEAKHSSPIPPTSQLHNSSTNNPFSSFSSKRFEHLAYPYKNSLPNTRKQKFSAKHQGISTTEKTTGSSSPPSQPSHAKQQQKSDTLPRKLVRGQDVWLGKGQEQTRQILKCMWCGSSFKTLAELTQHMQETQHYTKVISQEQITSWRSQAAAEGKSVSSASPLLNSPSSSSDSPSCLSSNLSSTRNGSGGGIFDSALAEKNENNIPIPANNSLTINKEPKDCITAILTCKVGLYFSS